MQRLSDFTDIPLTKSYRHYIDNQSVIDRLTEEEGHKYTTPNATLAPDWDIISTVALTTTNLPKHKYVWIASHQDRSTDRSELTLPACLNCEADDEATQFQANNYPRPTTPFILTTKAQLHLHNEQVDSHYKYRIREAATLPDYFKYLENKYYWSPATRATIDWPAYKQIVRKFRAKSTTLLKHVHEIAPTGQIAHRNNHHHQPGCPACNCDNETNDHMLQCPAATRSTWRTNILTKLHSTASNPSNNPILADILRDGLQRWLTGLPPIPLHTYPADYHALIISQNLIGWSHIVRGRWSSLWNQINRHHRHHLPHTNPTTTKSTTFVHQIGSLIITEWFDLWEIRNQERHGKDAEEKKAKRQKLLTSQLEELYSKRMSMLPVHRHIFMTDAQTHLRERPNLDGIEDWIDTFGPAILSSVTQAIAQAQPLFTHRE